MIWFKHSGYGIHCDIVNPRRLELEAAKELLADIYGIQIAKVEDLIRQHIVDFRLTGKSLSYTPMLMDHCSHNYRINLRANVVINAAHMNVPRIASALATSCHQGEVLSI
jgi:hypothetical protein